MADNVLQTTDQALSGSGPWWPPAGVGWQKGTHNVQRRVSNNLRQALFEGCSTMEGGRQAAAQHRQWAVGSKRWAASIKRWAVRGKRPAAGGRGQQSTDDGWPIDGLAMRWCCCCVVGLPETATLDSRHLCQCVGCVQRHYWWDSN